MHLTQTPTTARPPALFWHERLDSDAQKGFNLSRPTDDTRFEAGPVAPLLPRRHPGEPCPRPCFSPTIA